MTKRPTKTEPGVPQDGADVDHGGPRREQATPDQRKENTK